MEPLKAVELESFPYQGLEKIGTLVEYEGPLLVEFRTSGNDRVLAYWCDTDSNHHRWMYVRISESDLVRLRMRRLPLNSMIPNGCKDDFVIFADVNASGHVVKTSLVMKSLIPASYIPGKNSFVDRKAAMSDPHSFTVPIEGEWGHDDLGRFPKAVLEAYSFVRLTYTIGIGVEDHPDYQWRSRGGFTSHQYGEWAIKSLSGNERPKVGAIQYSSPGFVRFEVKREGVETLLQFVDVFRKNKQKANETYRAASTYLRDAKADDFGFIPENHSTQFRTLEIAIWTELEAQSIGDTISKISEANFTRLHVAMWFHRRIAELEKYQNKGMVFFPRT